MSPSTITALALGLLATTSAADTSLHYKLRARITGPQNAATPKANSWPLEVQRLGIPTRVPPDYMWGVLNNDTFAPSRGGDVFYTQPDAASNKTRVRTDAPNSSGEVTPFGFVVGAGTPDYPLADNQMDAVRYAPDVATEIAVDDAGVPFLRKIGYEKSTFVGCDSIYREWDLVYWLDVAQYGTGPIYHAASYLNCTEIQLVPECVSEGPSYEGLVETPCVADVAALL